MSESEGYLLDRRRLAHARRQMPTLASSSESEVSSLREGLGSGIIKPRSPEVRQISLVPVSRLKEYDLYSSDARILFPPLT